MIIESCHELVPPEEVKPIIEKIINNYITEYCQNQHITIGLNTIREILARMPLALDEAQIEYLVQFRHFKKNSSVRMAGKPLVNFFRDVCPQLLPKKYVGRFTDVDQAIPKDEMIYGERRMVTGIDGVELLKEGADVAAERILTDADLKKIRIRKLKQAARTVDKQGFADSDSDDENLEDLSSLSDKDEGEDDEAGSEEGEAEMSEEAEDEQEEEKKEDSEKLSKSKLAKVDNKLKDEEKRRAAMAKAEE